MDMVENYILASMISVMWVVIDIYKYYYPVIVAQQPVCLAWRRGGVGVSELNNWCKYPITDNLFLTFLSHETVQNCSRE